LLSNLLTAGRLVSGTEGLKKDWILLLVSTSGILLGILAAAIGAYHSAADGFHWQLAVVDVSAVSAMALFTWTIREGLKALGALVLAGESRDAAEAAEADNVVREKAKAANTWFRRGVVAAAFTAAAAVVALNWIG
jgi:hypothetical protein